MGLKEIMEREWENVRKGFYYPQLPNPRLVDTIPNAVIHHDNLQIEVNSKYVQDLGRYGIQESDAFNEVLTHEVTHFMKYPGSILNILRLQKVARNYVGTNKAAELRSVYTEAQTNLFMVKEKKHPATIPMTKVFVQEDDITPYDHLMLGLYQEIWQEDLGIKLADEEKSLVQKLKGIEYLNKENELHNFGKFVQLLKDYTPKEKSSKKKHKKGRDSSQNPLAMFSGNEIREGIKNFAQECTTPSEFEKIVKEVLSEGKEDETIQVTQAGIDKGITLIANNFYSAFAEKYNLLVRKKPVQKNGSLYPEGHANFSIADSFDELDPFSSPGILPGITKKWVKKEGEVTTCYDAVPNSMLLVDNSPSMFMNNNEGNVISPNEKVYHHIVGATAISNAYLNNDGKVAVYSFGSNDYFASFSKNKKEIHEALRRYSSSGGTTFNGQFIESVLKKTGEQFDLSVVSDMDISNLDNFMQTILEMPKTHRIHLIYTNNKYTNKVNQLRGMFGNKENVAILPMIREKDIKKIVLGELKKSVK